MDGSLQLQYSNSQHERQRPSWREGRFANWTVVLGDQRFRLHKYNLACASAFFEASMSEMYESSATDLTEILPKPCWEYFVHVLDAIYGEKRDGLLTEYNVVPMLVAADVLAMEELFNQCAAYVKEHTHIHFFTFWIKCNEFTTPRNPSLDQLCEVAAKRVARHFERLSRMDLKRLLTVPYRALVSLLESKDLVISSEVGLAHTIIEYGKAHHLLPSSEHADQFIELEVRYLPLCLEGLFKLEPVGSSTYRVNCDADNVRPVAYRLEKKNESKDRNCAVFHGEEVIGDDEGDGWIKTMLTRNIMWRRLASSICWTHLREQVHQVHGGLSPLVRIQHLGLRLSGQPPTLDKMYEWRWPFLEAFPVVFGIEGALSEIGDPHRTKLWPPHAPPLRSHQVALVIYFAGCDTPLYQELGGPVYSSLVISGGLQYRLKVFPRGYGDHVTTADAWNLSAYIEVVPQSRWPQPWSCRGVKFSVNCVPWENGANANGALTRTDVFTFGSNNNNDNRGWPDFLNSRNVDNLNSLLSPEGYLIIQADVDPKSTMEGPGLLPA